MIRVFFLLLYFNQNENHQNLHHMLLARLHIFSEERSISTGAKHAIEVLY